MEYLSQRDLYKAFRKPNGEKKILSMKLFILFEFEIGYSALTELINS